MDCEIWLPVVDYEGLYEVSDLGRVYSLRRGRLIKLSMHNNGHLRVTLPLDGGRRQRQFFVHTLVLTAFVGPCPDGLECCHWDDIKTNNYLGNLRWDTRAANLEDAIRNGRHHQSGKTHCKRGHEFTEENTYIRPRGGRRCRRCKREGR